MRNSNQTYSNRQYQQYCSAKHLMNVGCHSQSPSTKPTWNINDQRPTTHDYYHYVFVFFVTLWHKASGAK